MNRFSSNLPLSAYGKARGAIGLPGDSSPSSRFVKESFLLQNTVKYEDEDKNVSTAFHLLNSVSTLIGESRRQNGSYEYTIYSSIYSLDEKRLYIKTYENSTLQRYSLMKENLDGKELICHSISVEANYQDIN